MGRWIFFFTSLLLSGPLSGSESLLGQPILSLECRELLKSRDAKVINRQKILALIVRNKKSQEKLPAIKKTLKKKLEQNLIRLKQELNYMRDAIRSREETLIRRGCPAPEDSSII